MPDHWFSYKELKANALTLTPQELEVMLYVWNQSLFNKSVDPDASKTVTGKLIRLGLIGFHISTYNSAVYFLSSPYLSKPQHFKLITELLMERSNRYWLTNTGAEEETKERTVNICPVSGVCFDLS